MLLCKRSSKPAVYAHLSCDKICWHWRPYPSSQNPWGTCITKFLHFCRFGLFASVGCSGTAGCVVHMHIGCAMCPWHIWMQLDGYMFLSCLRKQCTFWCRDKHLSSRTDTSIHIICHQHHALSVVHRLLQVCTQQTGRLWLDVYRRKKNLQSFLCIFVQPWCPEKGPQLWYIQGQ